MRWEIQMICTNPSDCNQSSWFARIHLNYTNPADLNQSIWLTSSSIGLNWFNLFRLSSLNFVSFLSVSRRTSCSDTEFNEMDRIIQMMGDKQKEDEQINEILREEEEEKTICPYVLASKWQASSETNNVHTIHSISKTMTNCDTVPQMISCATSPLTFNWRLKLSINNSTKLSNLFLQGLEDACTKGRLHSLLDILWYHDFHQVLYFSAGWNCR